MENTVYELQRKSGDASPPTSLVEQHTRARRRSALLVEGTAVQRAAEVLRASDIGATLVTPFAAGMERRVRGAPAGRLAIAIAEMVMIIGSMGTPRQDAALRHADGVLRADAQLAAERERLRLEHTERVVRNAALIDVAADLEIPLAL